MHRALGQVMEKTADVRDPADGPTRTRARRNMRRIWIGERKAPNRRTAIVCSIVSFVFPALVWSAVSYVPALWHPLVEISDPGSATGLETGMRLDRALFEEAVASARQDGKAPPAGAPANPVYLPAPDQVARALWRGVTTRSSAGQSVDISRHLWKSIQIIILGFSISSMLGLPLGVLCGTSPILSRMVEPIIEFVRYMPAPAFGALMVAILGIYDGPKIAIIVIGTFFQQVLVIANTTRRCDGLFIEAAVMLGARNLRLVHRVIVPAVLPQLYRDQRILLGWAWTYLIVAELIGTSSGISFFITQQARYQHFDSVYAGILVIGIVGSGTDVALALLGRRLFPWSGRAA